jgi:hypothetical protein
VGARPQRGHCTWSWHGGAANAGLPTAPGRLGGYEGSPAWRGDDKAIGSNGSVASRGGDRLRWMAAGSGSSYGSTA